MKNPIILLRGLFYKLHVEDNMHSLKPINFTILIYTLLVLPFFALYGIIYFITEKLEDLVAVDSRRVETKRALTKKEKKEMKYYLLKRR